MKKIIILLPVYNDWESLLKVLDEINLSLKIFKNTNLNVLLSTMAPQLKNLRLLNRKILIH